MSTTVPFTLDGRELEAQAGETILQAAQRHGVAIPHLCYRDGLAPDGNCRACVVEIEGERVLAPSCCRVPAPGMKVHARGDRALQAQRMVLELLAADVPAASRYAGSELGAWCERMGLAAPRFAPRTEAVRDDSHPAVAVDLNACIQCTRCVRACRDVQGNDVIGYAGRGREAAIVFDVGDPLGCSTCVGCGECIQACPTGALAPAGVAQAIGTPASPAARTVDSLCPYCGVGCQVSYHVSTDGAPRIAYVTGRDGPANHGRLCVKGRFGFDYGRHRERLIVPLIRRDGVPKDGRMLVDPADWPAVFREASWQEALDCAATGLKRLRDEHGPHALAGFGSAKGSNEEAYLFQKLVRAGFGTNNVDHCTRLCHASSVAALLEGIGSGAVSNPVSDVQFADVLIVIGANSTVNHPVAATFMKNAVERGTRLILLDPRETELARYAWRYLQFLPDTDVALLNAMAQVIVREGLVDRDFVRERTTGFEAWAAHLAAYTPERMAPLCGIDAATIREVARAYAGARAAMIFWGMGISQHVHGTDNARCLIALALATGQIGRPGTGLHPLRGQNNVQGASDVGLIPFMLPDYQRVADGDVRARFERGWGLAPGFLPERPGLTVVEIMHAAERGEIRSMYIVGENPAMSDPDLSHARASLAALEHLVVQDIFLTETAGFADVVLPASAFHEKTGTFTNTDRTVQLARAALPMPGAARQDLALICELARRVDDRSGCSWDYGGARVVFEEMRALMPSIAGIEWERLEQDGAVTYPCGVDGVSHPMIFTQRFPTPDGRGRFVMAEYTPADELPDQDYPLVLITGRVLEHWHTGAMTRRANVLEALEPQPFAAVHPQDARRLGLRVGSMVRLETRRGAIELAVRLDEGMAPGQVFVPFCYVEAAANLLTNSALDPFGKIPEFKFCAVRACPVGIGENSASEIGRQELRRRHQAATAAGDQSGEDR